MIRDWISIQLLRDVAVVCFSFNKTESREISSNSTSDLLYKLYTYVGPSTMEAPPEKL